MNSVMPVCIGDYVWLLDNGVPFRQANYGDGEWQCILGYDGANAQGGQYTEQLQAELIETLVRPTLTYQGTNPGRKMLDVVNRWIMENVGPGVAWVYKEIFPNANLHGELGGFIAALRRRRVAIIGPAHLRNASLMGILNPTAFVEVPLPGAQYELPSLVERVEALIEEDKADVLCFSCGMATNVAMHRLAPAWNVTMIDCGAIWDPFVGVNSRGGYRKPKYQEALAKNIEEGMAE